MTTMTQSGLTMTSDALTDLLQLSSAAVAISFVDTAPAAVEHTVLEQFHRERASR
jgi:hypothetical protein